MNNKDKGSMEAASAEDLRQLRKSMETMQNQFFARIERRDSRLYDKLEEDREKNEEAYKELNNKLACIDKKAEVKYAVLATRIAVFVTLISIIATGFATTAWTRILG